MHLIILKILGIIVFKAFKKLGFEGFLLHQEVDKF
jgi:hypothetical protein